MSLLDEIAGTVQARKRPCIFARWLVGLDPLEQRDVEEALASSFPTVALFETIRKHYNTTAFSNHSLYKHRTGTCSCR